MAFNMVDALIEHKGLELLTIYMISPEANSSKKDAEKTLNGLSNLEFYAKSSKKLNEVEKKAYLKMLSKCYDIVNAEIKRFQEIEISNG